MARNQYAEAVLAVARSYIGVPYVLGGHTREGIDCRGLIRRAFAEVADPDGSRDGLRDLVGGGQTNVRTLYAWALQNGRLRDPAGQPGRAWVAFYASLTGGGAGPLNLAHVSLVMRPISDRWPKGRAISALNPVLDVRVHTLTLRGMQIIGYLEPAWPTPPIDPIDPPAELEPIPSIDPGDTEPPPDLEAIIEDLEATLRLAAADVDRHGVELATIAGAMRDKAGPE